MRPHERDPLWTAFRGTFLRRPRPNPLVVAWRWRYEIGTAIGLLVALVSVANGIGVESTLGLLALTTSALVWWPRSRALLVARFWCIVTPHRLRSAFVQTGLYAMSGRLPMIVTCQAKTWGEQITVWLPAGLVIEDVERESKRIAVACFADAVHVTEHPRRPHLVIVAVTRRRD